ncbi:Developmental regulator flbA [Colletotrichum fructicola]|uniref:Developmental regulator FlbA n=1 Tax=Colletotrichum fructicola (strain Nara gc5) TaxID=1213859 RepID=L2G1G1_COLFN|nr:Developmental regulator flbA [Colletotrichum fructicola]KAF4488684.1 Developmental regulator flbA [Colletotrichum fructicola Nara gc5]KAF4901361.1 Developmental regulator flbA [Colletotrichum fructicola]KAF4916029.1 Developmental regulator flbA [Colletotrichum fructicola]KAF4941624.1 Developmental regulator flbA [Colletotrichum fructicola]
MAAVSKTSRPPNHEPQSNEANLPPRSHTTTTSANPNPTTTTTNTTTTTPQSSAAATAAAAAATTTSSTTSTNTNTTSSSTDPYRAAPVSSVNRPHYRSHHHSPSISSLQKLQRSGGLFGFAAAAFDKTQSALATFSSDQSVRQRASSSALGRASFTPDSASDAASIGPTDKYPRYRSPSNYSSSSTSTLNHPEGKYPSQLSLVQDPPSQPYSETDPNRPLPIRLPNIESKMHQTSSRLLRMTDDDRPFTKDFKDLFSTLIVSLLPLSAHRVRLTRVENTFLSEDAINNLGSLKFSQSNRMPDPKDPSRIVTTTTTTTFSMAKDMARSICQKFLEARFIESADGKYQQVYNMKGSVWQLTPKGVTVLDRFCSRNGIQQKSISDLVGATLSQLVILERDGQTDKLITDRGTIEVIFRRFIGAHGPNVKSSVSSADSDSLSDYKDGLTGVKMASERKVNGKTYKDTFTGKAATDWLMDCCTTVDRRETYDIASLFVEYDLIEPVVQDRAHMAQYPSNNLFQPTKHSVYQLTAKGKDLINGIGVRGRTSESEAATPASSRNVIARDSNTQRLDKILNDAALRLLFRENLRETHCEENLSFYLDVDDFVRSCRQAIRVAQKNPNANSMDGIKEIMAQAYGIYNAFLAPGSPCELNIDHQLRNNLATRMTKAVGQDVAMIDTLQEVMSLFEDAQNAVFKLMASDSVPKFLRSPKYEHTLKNYDFDSVGGRGVERSTSRSNRK